jgi:cytidylate kinase
MKPLTIAIDGPSGAGKGTVARAVARQLGYRHVDSGAMYRAVGWKAARDGVRLDDEPRVAGIAAGSQLIVTDEAVTIDGSDVTRAIRTPDIDRAATAVARLPQVRAALVLRQRALGEHGGIVMEGRDIGTVVFPQADVKVYLDASPDPNHSGGPSAVADVATALTARDELDRTRSVSPLYAAEDAIVIDTTGKSVDEVVSAVLELVEEKRAGWAGQAG